ncbi:MAG: bifunctional riboflavin kinase/FAD synthetase [Gudongella sp.]|nr:bifunctional riboflavin kinase/FAD synthetase [Gudongella sp.]
MEIIRIDFNSEIRFQTALALGNFDGVHIGHQELIKSMIKNAKERKLMPSILIFENHTKSFVYGNGPRLINNNKQKNDFLEKLGIEVLYTMKFDRDIMQLGPEEFVKDILIQKLNCKFVTVGSDYRFGYRAEGDAKRLQKISKELDIGIEILNPLKDKGKVVSSTLVREYITDGNIREVNHLLARPFSIIGEVIHGKGIGKKMGVPTANLLLKNKYIIPKKGIYQTETKFDGKCYLSATNIGINPTFKDDELKIENHIIGLDEDIYGKDIEISFFEYLRPEMKFDSIDMLIEQMNRDIDYIKKNSDLQSY